MSHPVQRAAVEWLIACSPERTLLARRRDDGSTVLVKLLETGTLADAEREVGIGRRLCGDGVVRHLEASIDAATGKPCVVQTLVAGADLAAWVERHGPMDARAAAHVGLGIARALARFAAHSSDLAPAGLVHRDVKPANVLLAGDTAAPETCEVLLLDLEHACPVHGADVASGPLFTGGTHGFAPPEAYDGAAPDARFDVFGLGATLFFALGGRTPFGEDRVDRIEVRLRGGRWRRLDLEGCPEPLVEAIAACLARDPAERPTCTALAERFERFLTNPPDARAVRRERARRAAAGGDFAAARAELTGDADRALLRRIATLERRAARLGPPPAFDGEAPAEELVTQLAAQARRLFLQARVRPAGAPVLEQRAAFRRAVARLLHELPPVVAEHRRAARFGAAEAALDALETCVDHALRHGPLRPHRPERVAPTAAERAPQRYLGVARRELERARADLDALLDRLRAAERDADVRTAAAVIDAMAASWGGASDVVARAKDRLHRFEFYLNRIAGLAGLIDDVRALSGGDGVTVDLSAVEELRAWAAHRRHAPAARGGHGNVRALRRALRDLASDYPECRARVEAAVEGLERASQVLTDRAWELVAEAAHMLDVRPIPIRPLQSTIGRLDAMLLLDVLVERPGRPRTTLIDEIEAVRNRLEQARAARDRIAQGAREAMDRGHLTTALYEVERAVDRFGHEPVDEGPGLAEQFEQLKQRKQAVEDALAENHRLARDYAEAAVDPSVPTGKRMHLLQEREHVLSFLCTNLAPERAEPYARDLQAVHVDQVREAAAEGETLLKAARGARERREVAQRTFAALQRAAPDLHAGGAAIEEVRRLLRRWQEEAEASHPAAPARRSAARRGQRLLAWSTAVVILGVATVVGWRLAGERDTGPLAAVRLTERLGEPHALLPRDASDDAEFDTLRAFVDMLAGLDLADAGIDAAAVDLVASVARVRRGAARFAAVSDAHARFRTVAAATADEPLRVALDRFGRRALRAGFAAAARQGGDPTLRERLAEDGELRRSLSAEDADLLQRWVDF